MKWLLIYIGLSVLAILVDFVLIVYDNYRYPVCPRCESNRHTKRTKGKVICRIHNEIDV